ncbi:hypothetical protein O181_108654 [Austropuccinia psidii MF-1]|uniref:Uncharacterized protein n=1 Tax=Austropuccinia psidii MF-1 TaxID=1389203 RepID=A0A9Q3PP56_9BASI|nr:hypothetical protein [Austropuccinia psidii MF-1]
MPSTRSGASYNPWRSSQKGYRHDYGRSQSVTEGQGADMTRRSLSGNIKSQPESLQQCIAAQSIPDPCRYVEKLHQFLPDCEKIPGPSQLVQVTQWMASIDGKETHDTFNSRMQEKQPFTTQASAKNSPSSHKKQVQCEKEAKSPEQGKRQGTTYKALQPGLQNPKNSARCHGKCISDAQDNDVLKEKEEARLKYQK